MRACLCLLVLMGCTAPATDTGWVQVWADEFNADEGTPVNPDNWVFDVGGDGWGNNQLEYNTDRVENVFHDGLGNLRIRAQREAFEDNAWTSGRITTNGTFDWYQGRFVARIKAPAGEGMWPAFWMLGDDFETVGWPICGEIDIFEGNGALLDRTYGTIHGPGYSGGDSVGATYAFPDGGTLDAWHIYAVEVDEGLITWSVDGEVFQRRTRADLPDGMPWVFDHPFFMILNLAVGGVFVTEPTDDTPDVNDLFIDFVRVFQRTN